jgi:hypothetical protein
VELEILCSAEVPRPNNSAAKFKRKNAPRAPHWRVEKDGGNYQMEKELSISTREAWAAFGNLCSMERIEQGVR